MSINGGDDRQPVRFGVFEINLHTGELRKSGSKIKLQEQPFRVLTMLVEHRGEVVTREEIRNQLWDGDVHVDFDHGLNMAVKKIRAALGDSANNPRFVETLPKRGYRFVAPVEVFPAAGGQRKEPRSLLAWMLPFAALVLISTAVLAWRAGRPEQDVQLTAIPLSSYPREEIHPSFSPDGNEVAFSWNGERPDNFDIYVKGIHSSDARRLTADPAREGYPAWSPDGRLIAFVREAGESSKVILVPSTGGPERELARSEGDLRALAVGQTSLSWFPDGKSLVIRGLKLVSAESGETRDLTVNTAGIDYDPAVSPDGRLIVFSRTLSGALAEIFLLELTADRRPKGEPRRLTDLSAVSDGAAWISDGSAIVFSSGVLSGRRSLWRLPLSDPGNAKRISGLGENGFWPATSRHGYRMAYVQRTAYPDIWRVRLPGVDGKPGTPEPLIQSSRGDWNASYSPDGSRIVFVSNRTGQTAIWLAEADGKNARELYSKPGEHLGTPRWSPDGQRLAFDMTVDEQLDIFAIDNSGRTLMRLTEHPASDSHPMFWSRDGKWIYFLSERSGRLAVWKVGLTGEQPEQVVEEDGYPAQLSSDGDFIYYLKGARFKEDLWRVPVAGGRPDKIISPFPCWPFVLTERGLYYSPKRRPGQVEHRSLKFRPLVTGAEETILAFPSARTSLGSISPDGQWWLYQQNDNYKSDLMLVENFH